MSKQTSLCDIEQSKMMMKGSENHQVSRINGLDKLANKK